MFWISRGKGGLAFWIPLVFVTVPPIALDSFHLFPGGSAAFHLILGGLLLAAGVITAALGFYLNRGPGFWTIDPATGLRYFDKAAKHSFFLIPMQYWGLFYCAVVVLIAVLNR